MSEMSRREFLSLMGGTAAAAAMASGGKSFGAAPPEDFSFIFLTDCHEQPELDGIHGTDLAMREARKIEADFAIQGGDHVFDALGVSKERATQLFDLYGKTEQDLGLKVHHTIGNHDCFGVYTASGVPTTDPQYGKKMYTERFGPAYYSFQHKGVHFAVLDSIGITPDRFYEARMDDDQLAWLGKELAAVPAGEPIVVVTHIPLVTAVPSYTVPTPQAAHGNGFVNGPAAIKLFEGRNVLAVLQGHTHVNEEVVWHGVPYLTSGAVCGNWWHGTRLGTPEGFTVVTISGGKLSTRYVPTGFKSVAPANT
jgi:3',5'-cyclic AMP phosphodiesterase CpdA